DLVLDPDFCLAQELQRVLVLTAKYANRPMDPGPTGLMCVNALHPSRKDHTAMSRYISLLQFTEQGSKNIKKSTARAHAFDKLAAKAGVKVEGQYWTMGNYDGVLVLSADSEQKVLHLLTELASLGNVRTSTMQAFGDDEFDQIVGRK
ncbi:MAG: GYD domain-containing protein, partial [Limisphaerales bacterium]